MSVLIFELMCKYPHLVSAALLVSSLASKASLPALKVSSGVFSSSRQGRQGGKQQGGEQGEVASLPSGVRTQTECEARQRQSGVLTTQGFGNIFIHTCVSCLGVECCDSLLLHSFTQNMKNLVPMYCLKLGNMPLFVYIQYRHMDS